MKTVLKSMILIMTLGYISAVSAVPPGMEVEFSKSPMGKVTFSGKLHAEKGLMCNDCHTAIFEQKKGAAQITMADHEAGQKYCFTCHNGTKSFETKDNCARCHKQ